LTPADTTAESCKTACQTAIDGDANKATSDYCCEVAVTAAKDAVVADPDNGVEAADAVAASSVCTLHTLNPNADPWTTIQATKAAADGVTYFAAEWAAGEVKEEEAESTDAAATTDDAAATTDDAAESTDDEAADSATKMVASVLASAAFIATMY